MFGSDHHVGRDAVMDLSAARAVAVRMLSRREHAALELEQKLIGKGCDADTAADVLHWCQQNDLQSEERFVGGFVRQRRARLYGPRRIRAELAAKGVEDDLISVHLDGDEAWLQAAREFVDRKSVDLSAYRERGKVYQALLRRGFTAEQAGTAVHSTNHNRTGS